MLYSIALIFPHYAELRNSNGNEACNSGWPLKKILSFRPEND